MKVIGIKRRVIRSL